MHRLTLHLFLLISALFLVSCAVTPYSTTQNNARERALSSYGYSPLKIYSYNDDSRYWSPIKLAHSDLRLLLDSGANSTDVDRGTATRVGVQQKQDYEVISKGALGREIRSKLGVTRFQYGPQVIDPFVVVINEGHSKKTSVGKYNGQIGLDALVESAALIDISNEKVWVPSTDIPGHHRHPLLGANNQLGYEGLPLYSSNKYSHLILEGSYQGARTSWIVDTGAEVSVLDRGSARRLGLLVTETNSKMVDVSGDTSKLGFTIPSTLVFGNTRLSSLPLAVANLGNVKNSFKLPDGKSIDGILGVDFLKYSKALIDPRSKIIHLGHAEYRGSNEGGVNIISVR